MRQHLDKLLSQPLVDRAVPSSSLLKAKSMVLLAVSVYEGIDSLCLEKVKFAIQQGSLGELTLYFDELRLTYGKSRSKVVEILQGVKESFLDCETTVNLEFEHILSSVAGWSVELEQKALINLGDRTPEYVVDSPKVSHSGFMMPQITL